MYLSIRFAALFTLAFVSNVVWSEYYEESTRCILPPPTNAIQTWPKDKISFKIYSRVWYSCKDGYRLDSLRRKRTCLSGGKWNRSPPKCVPYQQSVTCTLPKLPDAVRTWPKSQTVFEPNSSVWYSCAIGYELDSTKRKRYCLEGGQWNRSPPNCIKRSCEQPTSPEFGSFRPSQISYNIGDEVWFSCDSGYEISGAADITCRSELNVVSWSAEEPTCVPSYVQTCSPPTIPNFGSLRPEQEIYQINEEIWFSCNAGYKLQGTADITCLSNINNPPTWSASEPTCVVQTCTTPTQPEFGSFAPLEGPYNVGTVVWFTCDEGYEISGIVDTVCVSSSDNPPQWATVEPTCVPVIVSTCVIPGTPEYGSYRPIQLSYEIGNEIWFSCDEGYEISGAPDLTCIEIPGSSPIWSAPEPLCVPIIVTTCPTPAAPENGSFRPNEEIYNIGDVLWFMCNPGYEIDGIADVTCTASEDVLPPTWSPTLPTCVMVEACNPPTQPLYGSYYPINSLYEVGDDVTFSCDAGYEMEGTSVVICLENSGNPPTWSATEPSCVPIVQECGPLAAPSNGNYGPIKSAYSIEEVVWFSCDLGYILEGAKDITCTEDPGQRPFWDAVEPTCVRVTTCQPPNAIEFGSFRPTQTAYEIGEEIWFDCKEGYEIQGARDITCVNVEGDFPRWSDTETICIEKIVYCPKPAAPAFGLVFPDLENFEVADVVIFDCSTANYVLEGSPEATCQSDGTWDLPVPVCNFQADPVASCNGRCHDYADNSLPCQCDIHCEKAGNCCSDYNQYCLY